MSLKSRPAVRHFLRRYFLFAAVIAGLLAAIVYYFYWHWRPFTQNAFVFANTRKVTPLVAGYITEICVRNNQFVKKGDPLFRTFRPPYALKAVQLEQTIESEQASVKSIESQISAANEKIRQLEAQLANDTYLSRRADEMYAAQAVSQTYAEERLRAMQATAAALAGAKHDMTSLTHQRSARLKQIAKLEAELKLAKIYDGQTTVCALSDGYVTNMSIAPGGYYEPGDVLFGFVDTTEWFIQANFQESELSEIRPGMKAKIWLKQYPGRVFSGVVGEPGWSAERRKSAGTGLPEVQSENEWFLLPQRYPVQIRLIDPPDDLALHPGGSAYVELDALARPVRQFFWELFLWW